jgi:3-oxoacyl-[acyl-carrier-protein] synthase II
MGAVTPLGPDLPSSWDRLLAGDVAVDRITAWDPAGFPVQIAAEIRRERPLPLLDEAWIGPHRHDRRIRFALHAASEAWAQAGLDSAIPDPARVGLSVGAEAGRKLLQKVSADYARWRHLETLESVVPHIDPFDYPRLQPWAPTRLLARAFGILGPARTSSTACTSGAQALGRGLQMLRRGDADVVLAGGTDALVEAFMVTGFALIGALSERNDDPRRASRPFDQDRDGFVLAEGAGFVVLESEEHARTRGAPILGWLRGYGSSLNAYRITDSPPDGGGAYEALRDALTDARVAPQDLGYVNAHGTSTLMNDLSETRAIHRALGEAASSTPVSSNKGQMGHLVAAAGAVEAVFTWTAMRHGVLPATVNLDRPDPQCDLDHIPNQPREVPVQLAASNSFGFGGSNASLLLQRGER